MIDDARERLENLVDEGGTVLYTVRRYWPSEAVVTATAGTAFAESEEDAAAYVRPETSRYRSASCGRGAFHAPPPRKLYMAGVDFEDTPAVDLTGLHWRDVMDALGAVGPEPSEPVSTCELLVEDLRGLADEPRANGFGQALRDLGAQWAVVDDACGGNRTFIWLGGEDGNERLELDED